MTFTKYYVRWRHNDEEALTEFYEFLGNALFLDEKVETNDYKLRTPTVGDRYRNPYIGKDMIIVDSVKGHRENEPRYCLWFADPKYKSSSKCPGINMDYADDIVRDFEYVNSKLRPGYYSSTNSSTEPYRLVTNYNMVTLKDGRVVKIVDIENGDTVNIVYPSEMITKGKMNVSVMQALKL